MATDVGKALVIDASIARAAGPEDATAPTSKQCRDLLVAVLESIHRLTMTPEIQQEWNKHQGRFAIGWRVAMDRKNKIQEIPSPGNADLRDKVTSLIGQKIGKTRVTQEICSIMLKDCVLLEAALQSGKSILSLDEKVRFHFSVATENIGEIREIVWVNPDKAEENAIAWLEAGANPEEHRQLGFQQTET